EYLKLDRIQAVAASTTIGEKLAAFIERAKSGPGGNAHRIQVERDDVAGIDERKDPLMKPAIAIEDNTFHSVGERGGESAGLHPATIGLQHVRKTRGQSSGKPPGIKGIAALTQFIAHANTFQFHAQVIELR